jgi:hypothetical protein
MVAKYRKFRAHSGNNTLFIAPLFVIPLFVIPLASLLVKVQVRLVRAAEEAEVVRL